MSTVSRTAAERAAIDRDGARCLRCGVNLEGRSASVHHRKLKGRATPRRDYDLVENLVVLCGTGTTGCHSWCHHNRAEAARTGWIVPSWDDPALVPLVDRRGHLFYLLPNGMRTTPITEDDPWLSGHGNTEQGA